VLATHLHIGLPAFCHPGRDNRGLLELSVTPSRASDLGQNVIDGWTRPMAIHPEVELAPSDQNLGTYASARDGSDRILQAGAEKSNAEA
jgi:hypothetical protein